MSLENDKVVLKPLTNCDNLAVLHAWQELFFRSAEVIASGYGLLDEFAEECVYVAVISEKCTDEEPNDMSSDDPDMEEAVGNTVLVPVGILYLKASSLPGSFDIGISLIPDIRGRHLGPEALSLAISWAFGELGCHRIQARVVKTDEIWRDVAVSVFSSLGFELEGSMRRALFCPTKPGTNSDDGEWRDITTLAILDMHWAIQQSRAQLRSRTMKSRWDELFAKEDRERQELLNWEQLQEERKRLKRSASSETITTQCQLPERLWIYSSPQPEYPFGQDSLYVEDKGKQKQEPDDSATARLIQEAFPNNGGVSHSSSDTEDSLPRWDVPPAATSTSFWDQYRDPSELKRMKFPFLPRSSHYNVDDDLRSVASSTYSRFSSYLEVGSDPFSDSEEPPRSPVSSSAATSRSGSLDDDEWEALETSSVGSSDAWNVSEDEF